MTKKFLILFTLFPIFLGCASYTSEGLYARLGGCAASATGIDLNGDGKSAETIKMVFHPGMSDAFSATLRSLFAVIPPPFNGSPGQTVNPESSSPSCTDLIVRSIAAAQNQGVTTPQVTVRGAIIDTD